MRDWRILCALLALADADMYLHNPRGSNNRLDEEGRERRNANRMFDSQNNNRGGYNVGSVYYYGGSRLPIEWTNQHSCGAPNNHCEIIIQYMCTDSLRDGATTSTIPENLMQCANYDCNSDARYGMHENYDYYLKCKLRARNEGLFTADQDLKRNRAKNTRQNPNGNRRAYECPEERDYYPYWHPTPWRDIAVLTNNASRCAFYRENSENVRGRHECVIDRAVLIRNQKDGNLIIPNNEQDCLNFRYPEGAADGARGVWTLVAPHGVPAPECREADFSRDNHLGNGIGGQPNVFNWTVPELPHERCALRIRYNISTADYPAWDADAALSRQVDTYSRFGFPSKAAAAQRGYVFKNNPKVEVFPGLDVQLQLAVNTAQFGRTFQDRSHRFAIRPRPAGLDGGDIHNVNVRGKRGNIVQVYPAVEYDFVPNRLHVPQGDHVHFQWTGSNSNPHNNDGQGRRGTDRSNVLLQRAQAYPEGTGLPYRDTGGRFGHWGRSYPEHVTNSTLLGLSEQDLMSLAVLIPGQFGGEMSELDDAGTYFDLGPRKVTRAGIFHYLCTRNNNFSNRSQKGRITCDNVHVVHRPIGINGGNMTAPDGSSTVMVEEGDFETLQRLEMQIWSHEDATAKMRQHDREAPMSGEYASPFVVLHPEAPLTAAHRTFTMDLAVDSGGVDRVSVYRSNTRGFNTWTKVDAEVSGGRARFEAREGGVYVAVRQSSLPIVLGALFGALALVALLAVGAFFYCRKHPKTLAHIKRHFTNKV